MPLSRRRLLAGISAIAAAGLARPALAQGALDGTALGLDPSSAGDQTARLQAALQVAVQQGRPLALPAGEYRVASLTIPGGATITGVFGSTYLVAGGGGPAAVISGASNIVLQGIGFAPGETGPSGDRALLDLDSSSHVHISRCRFIDSAGHGIAARQSAATIEGCDFNGHAGAGIFSMDGRGLMISNCTVSDCGNGGILIWRGSNGADGSVVTGNRISAIRADGGGNGQNGNGINVFHADEVIVADNHIAGCAFTAVRLNTTSDTIVRGNICRNSGEVAIFSEFGFSGSIIADNIVDGAATGISVTNLDDGGRLAVVSGNMVRNIAPLSRVNPDTRPYGIHVEADTVVTGNAVDAVPGIGISAGYGPFLRNVVVAGNVVGDVDIGIAISVAGDAGPVRVSGNMISARRFGIAGLAWQDVVSDDLVRDAERYPHVALDGNTVTPL